MHTNPATPLPPPAGRTGAGGQASPAARAEPKAAWQRLTPKPWQKRRPPEIKPVGPPRDKHGPMLWRLDPASPAADALRELRERLTIKRLNEALIAKAPAIREDI